MDKRNKRCVHCGDEFEFNPRLKNQIYCGKKECRLARRALWQREKLRNDPAYKDNQKDCWKEWYSAHPNYQREYRKKNTQYTDRNRLMQRQRNIVRRKNGLDKMIVKMDSLTNRLFSRRGIPCRIVVDSQNMIVKMDLLRGKLFIGNE